MTFTRMRLFAVAGTLSLLLTAAAAVEPAGARPGPAAAEAAAAPAQSGFVFWGCWTQWPGGTCRDVFRDSQGNYWICRACGTTGTPNTSKCSRISSQTLNTGRWCS